MTKAARAKAHRYEEVFEDLADSWVVGERVAEPVVSLQSLESRLLKREEDGVGLLEGVYQRLNPEHRKELLDFARFLQVQEGVKKASKPAKLPKMNFRWAGALKHLKDRYSAIELQKHALSLRKG